MQHHAPRGTGPHEPAQAIADLPQTVALLGGVCGHEGHVRGDKGPYVIGPITRVCFGSMPSVQHQEPKVHNTL